MSNVGGTFSSKDEFSLQHGKRCDAVDDDAGAWTDLQLLCGWLVGTTHLCLANTAGSLPRPSFFAVKNGN